MKIAGSRGVDPFVNRQRIIVRIAVGFGKLDTELPFAFALPNGQRVEPTNIADDQLLHRNECALEITFNDSDNGCLWDHTCGS